jgi:uncharacterized protein
MIKKDSAFKQILEELQKDPVNSVFLVTRDGSLEEAVGFRDIYAETFAAMCATMFGAGETANLELDREEPEYVFLKSNEGSILITGAGEEHILAVVSSKFIDPEGLLGKMEEHLKELIALTD